MRTTTRATTGESTGSTITRPDSAAGASRIRTNTSWAFAGNAVYAGCQWVVFVLLVKTLPLAEVGRFAYWLAVTGPVFVLANVRLRNLLATGVASPDGFRDYFAARLLTTGAAVCCSVLIGAMAAADSDSLVVVTLIACAKAFDALSDICHGLFQRELDMRRAALGLIANGILSVALVGLSLAIARSLPLATGAYAAASLLALAAWDLPRSRSSLARRGTAGTMRAVARLLRRAMPLGLSAAIGSLQVHVPRYVVAASLGPAALAVFTALAYIPTLGNLIVNAVAQAVLPVLARELQVSRGAYRRRVLRLVAAGAALGALSVGCTALFGRTLLTFVYQAEYAVYLDVLLWLMLAAAVTYGFVFLGTASTARTRFGAQFVISSCGLIAVGATVAPLVARFGLAGAAYALLAGALVEASLYAALTVYDLASDGGVRALPTTATGGITS